MRHVRSLAFRAFALPLGLLLGVASTGCPGQKTTSGDAGTGNSGGGGSGGSPAGAAGSAGTSGSAGSGCEGASAEICDGIDNDCDGTVDNVPGLAAGCACNDGETQECYSGAEGTAGVGLCAKGMQTCAKGAWGACAGEVVPVDEDCNLKDDDCNGQVDDMGVAVCGVGACMAMVDKCINGQPQQCVTKPASVEVCDGIDNNCNQLVDESDPDADKSCQTGLFGPCAVGKQKCVGEKLTCIADVMPVMESCDGVDNNCDGTVDNAIPGTGGTCSTGALGVCAEGTISCGLFAGSYTVDCFPDVPSSAEVCDGKDNDCDGTTDENNPGGGTLCDTGLLGECQAGTLQCLNGAIQCKQNVASGPEQCDGKDNNCDGQSDEGSPGAGQPCGCAGAQMGTTSCNGGQLVCGGGGPTVYFAEEFANNTKTWTLESGWQIGPAMASSGQSSGFGADPAMDHTPTADNGIAGTFIGQNVPIVASSVKYMLSPVIDMTGKSGSIVLTYWRVLNSDYPGYQESTLDVKDVGGNWVNLFSVAPVSPIKEFNWTKFTHDVSAYAANNPSFQIRFGLSSTGSSGTYTVGGWNVDDVTLASAACQ